MMRYGCKGSVRWTCKSAALSVRPVARSAGPALLLCCIVLLSGGCSRLDTQYGKSTGRAGKRSLNGFGALRALYEIHAWEARSISRVGPRLDKLETIVWTPSVNTPLSGEVTQWFDQWLANDGKTLVCVVYDGGAEAAYWRQAARFATPLQRLEYRRRAARAEIAQLQEFLQQPVPESNGWFQISKRPFPLPMGPPSGPWAPEASAPQRGSAPSSASDTDLAATTAIHYEIAAFDASQKPAATPGALMPWMKVVERSEVETQLEPLLESATGLPVVMRVRSPDWGDSQVLVVSAGSLLTNYGLTQPLGRSLAHRVVTASGPPGQVGFLTSDWSGIGVSSALDGRPRKSGMELLTVWPLSLVTIHAALLGLVVCLILMPIFGRPRNPRQHSQSDFTDHLDAVAGLLARAGGDQYARHRISDYMRRVRGETSGPWVLPEPPHAAPAALPHDAAMTSPTAMAVAPKPTASSTDDHASLLAPGDDR